MENSAAEQTDMPELTLQIKGKTIFQICKNGHVQLPIMKVLTYLKSGDSLSMKNGGIELDIDNANDKIINLIMMLSYGFMMEEAPENILHHLEHHHTHAHAENQDVESYTHTSSTVNTNVSTTSIGISIGESEHAPSQHLIAENVPSQSVRETELSILKLYRDMGYGVSMFPMMLKEPTVNKIMETIAAETRIETDEPREILTLSHVGNIVKYCSIREAFMAVDAWLWTKERSGGDNTNIPTIEYLVIPNQDPTKSASFVSVEFGPIYRRIWISGYNNFDKVLMESTHGHAKYYSKNSDTSKQ